MKKRTICVTTGTRAEFGILNSVLKEIQKSKNLDLKLIVTGTHLSNHHGQSIKEIQDQGFKEYHKIKINQKTDTNYQMSIDLGKSIIEFSKTFKSLNPDINLVLGDRDEMLASTIAAYHMNIPVAHIHGGDRSQGGIDEYNRHAITKMSNIHFPATKKSYNRILKMGENPNYVFLTGSPSIDQISNSVSSKNYIEKELGIKITGNEIILLQHSVTTETQLSQKQINETLQALLKHENPVILIAPNSDAGYKNIYQTLEKFSEKYDNFYFYQNLKRSIFLGLLKYCGILIGNSSSGMIEASFFGIPVINIGIRQNKREYGKHVINVKQFDRELIYKALLKAKRMKHSPNYSVYGNGNASKKIIKILETIKIDDNLIKKQIFY